MGELRQAGFCVGDRAELLAASVACDWCLHRPWGIGLVRGPEGDEAHCECGFCGAMTVRRLSSAQSAWLVEALRAPTRIVEVSPTARATGDLGAGGSVA